MAASEPIDIEEDGVWEFAIKTADTPPLYGVYSYAKRSWIDGPRELPQTPGAWSANDYDGDGLVEYAYQWGNSIRLYDPVADLDSTLWLQSGEDIPQAIFWGKDATGRFMLAEKVPLSDEYGFSVISRLVVRDLLTGEHRLTSDSVITSPFNASELIPDFPQEGQIGRLLVYENAFCSFNTPTNCYTRVQLCAIGPDWQTEAIADFIDWAGSSKDGYWGVESAAVQGVEPSLTRFIALGLPINYHGLNAALCSFGGTATKTCDGFSTDWDYAKGIWVDDVDEDGRLDLVIARSNNSGWELHDPYDLSSRGFIPNMPSVRVSTGPLQSAGQYDMFYFQGDSLYVWAPRGRVGGARAFYGPKVQAAVGGNSFSAYPNPFNNSVRLTWPAQDVPVRIDILNILGESVRSISVVSEATSAEWGGRDNAGQLVPSGIYFARLTGQKTTATVKIVLLK